MKGMKFLAIAVFIFAFIGLEGHSIAAETGTITGKVITKKAKFRRDCVVYIEKVEGNFPLPKEHPIMDQSDLAFIPHVLPILVGTPVDYLNSDPISHNVFSPDEVADKVNLGTWETGTIRSYTFTKLGSAVMLCNVHAEMEAYVVVLQNPYFFKTQKDGKFTISNVPPGEYVLKVWNKRFKGEDAKVVVKAGETVSVDMRLTKKR
ncbi:MAG: beta-sandwich domain-containing protein [Candidatus Brocadiales bacterium]